MSVIDAALLRSTDHAAAATDSKDTRLVSANSTLIPYLGRCELTVEALGRTVNLCFFIVENLNPHVILGCDWCSEVELLVSFARGHAALSSSQPSKSQMTSEDTFPSIHCDDPKPYFKEPSTFFYYFYCLLLHLAKCFRILSGNIQLVARTLVEVFCRTWVKVFYPLLPLKFTHDPSTCLVVSTLDVTIPKSSAVWVQSSIQGNRRSGDFLVEAVLHSQPGTEFATPRSLISSRRGALNILVVNLATDDIHLKRGESLGTAFEILPETMIATVVCSPVVPTPESRLSKDDNIPWTEFNFGPDLTATQRESIQSLLKTFRHCIAITKQELGCTPLIRHTINTGDHAPIHHQPRRVSISERQEISAQVDDLLRRGVVAHSNSPWSSPVVLVKKKDGSTRFCIDYRKLNSITKPDVYPLPRLDDALDRLQGCKYFTTLDLISGYWQVELESNDAEKSAFVTPDGLFEFRRLPFGLCNAPATFQRLMDRILGRLKWTMALVYLDDVIVYADSFDEHQQRLGLVLDALTNARLRLNPSKCFFRVQ